MDGGSIWTVIVVAIALALALVGLNAAFADAAESNQATRNITVDQGSNVSVEIDAYEVTDNETVTSNGTTLSEGSDYNWYPTEQTLEWLTSSNTTNGDDATLDVQIEAHEQAERTTGDLLSAAGSWIGILLLVTAIAWILNVALGGGF